VLSVFALTGGETPQSEAPPAVIQSSEPPAPTVPPASRPPNQPSKPPATQPTQATQTTQPPATEPTSAPTDEPSTAPSQEPTQEPTQAPTQPPTQQPTSPPTGEPTQSPSEPPPALNEGLLTIDTPTGGNGGNAVVVDEAAPSARRRLNIAPLPGTARVTVQIGYGTRLAWPVAGNPPGWTCVANRPARIGLCTAAKPADPAPLTIEFVAPNGGASRDRTFTATARTYVAGATKARYFDDDNDRIKPAGRNDAVLDVSKGSGTTRTLGITPPEDNTDPVVVEIGYGAALSWPVDGDPRGWTCDAKARTCTARDEQNPAPLPLRFVPPEGGSDVERTYTITVRVGDVYDIEAETLKSVFDPETLLKVRKDDYGHHLFKLDFTVTPPARYDGTVTLLITYGEDLFWTYRDATGWACRWNPKANTVRCITKNTLAAGPLRGYLHLIGDHPKADASLTATATAGIVSDTDSYPDLRPRESRASPPGSRRRPRRRPGSRPRRPARSPPRHLRTSRARRRRRHPRTRLPRHRARRRTTARAKPLRKSHPRPA
jgi:hypothetical protein